MTGWEWVGGVGGESVVEIDVDKLPMLETSSVLTCYADCMGAAEILEPGANVRITFVELHTIGGVRYRVPVLKLTRPLWSCAAGVLQAMLRRTREAQGKVLVH